MERVTDLFDPDRVAVVGATDRAGSIGRAVVENLLDGFRGEVVAVNPDREEVLGRPCYPSVSEVPGPVDLVVVVVPARVVVPVVEEVGECGIDNVVVISAGFGETGEEGARRERDLRAVAERYDLTLVGPNSLGIISTPSGLNATFVEGDAQPGSISFLSQSGAFIAAVLDWAVTRHIGFKDVVSLGNEAVLDEVDFVEAWGDDPDTDVVLGYVEDVDDGRRFIETTREVTRETPVVLLKSGRTEAGASAAASHTGSLAGSDRAYEAAFQQAGVVRADTVQELFDYGQVLAGEPDLSNRSVGILTNAGGPGVLAADAVEDTGLSLATFDDATRERLRSVLPRHATARNPLDIIGDAGLDRFEAALEVLLEEGDLGSLLVIACPTALFDFEEFADRLADVAEASETPLVTCLMGGESAARAARRLAERNVPNFFDPARAVQSLGVLAEYQQFRTREPATVERFDVDTDRAAAVLDRATERGRTQLGPEAMELLDAYGIPVPDGQLVESASAAADAAAHIGEEVVMKVVSPDIVHKSDVGGVEVGVAPAEASAVYETLLARARAHDPDAEVLGVYVQELVDVESGVEVIAGAKRDPQFGPLLMFGLGGVFVEILEDISFRVGPLAPAEARAMTEEIRSAPMLRGARGRDPVDIDAVVEVLQRLSQLAADFPRIREFDVNPLVAAPDGALAVDFRVTVDAD
ncbi:MAG: acetate--CoA ligase family protein [Haloarculaceae archaeon]